MKKKIKKVTLESLSATIEHIDSKMGAGFNRLDAKMDAGFKRLDSKMDAGFNQAEENRESLARIIKGGFDDVLERLETKADKSDIIRLEQGQENILLRLDYLAPQFEVKELTRRVKRLEDKVGIRHTGGH